MALTLPTPADLEDHRDGVDDAEALQRAADLFTLATGLTTTPTDPFEARLVSGAILDMAWFLQINHEDREAEFSPFSSERIGSYSYSKLQKAAEDKLTTGVSWFDKAVLYFTSDASGQAFGTTSEWVFADGYVPLETADEYGVSHRHDPGH